jgi:S-adenosylmethionine:tRNA ribosyltransferase-isomerase
LKTNDFDFELPPELIAQTPSEKRGDDRLMLLNRASGSWEHCRVNDLPALLPKGTLLVFNNSRVRKARLYGTDCETGVKAEFLLVHRIDDTSWQVMTRHTKRMRSGRHFAFENDVEGEIVGDNDGEFRTLRFSQAVDDAWLDLHGHVPLPPYIKRGDNALDSERYQTVYAREYGSAAAPTAGLHFTDELLGRLRDAGFETAFITLHVGLGTFLPVRVDNIEDHQMHEEVYSIDNETASRIEQAAWEGRNILAVGTTSVRTLESAWDEAANNGRGALRRGAGATSIFIYPPYRFKVVKSLFTNFHTPKSTLLMLVSALAGREVILNAYTEAVRQRYRFYSYGDAMLIL